MRVAQFFIAAILFLLSSSLSAQEWRQYTSDDAVSDFVAHKENIWIVSGSGLTKLDRNTLEKTTWNVMNSDIPQYRFDHMAIDSVGTVWIDYEVNNDYDLLSFDGQNFEKYTELDGKELKAIYDMETAPDGTFWILANTQPLALYRYVQNQFNRVPLPSSNLQFDRTSASNIFPDAQNHLWMVVKDTVLDKNFIGELSGTGWTLHDISSHAVVPEGDDAWAVDPLGRVVLFCKDRSIPVLMRWDGLAWTRSDLPYDATKSVYAREALSIDAAGHIRILLDDNAYLYFDGVSWSTVSLTPLVLADGEINELYLDIQSRWWFTQNTVSVSLPVDKLYLATGSVTQLIDLSNDIGDLPTNQIFYIYIDRLNHKWMTSGHGLLDYDGQSWIALNPPTLKDFFTLLTAEGPDWLWYISPGKELYFFDGVASSKLPILYEDGTPPEYIQDYAYDSDGRILISPSDGKIMVFDHGTYTYLPQTIWKPSPNQSIIDYPRLIAFGPDGKIYALGFELYRFEEDSTWTTLPMDELPEYAYDLWIGSDTTIWVALLGNWPGETSCSFFDGATWNTFDAPSGISSAPKEDSQGGLWTKTPEGLCHLVNQTWTCYDRSNSPIVPERISDFAIDRFDNVWIVMSDGGLLLFNPVAIVDAPADTFPVASGTVYRDLNQNGTFDVGDTPLPLQRQLMLPDNVLAFSSYSGQYKINAYNGDHEVKYVPRPNWHIDNTPAAYNITVSDQSVTNLDFALAPDEEKVDLNLFLSEGFARCNSLSRYTLTAINWGTMAEELIATLVLDPSVTPHEINPLPDVINGDTLSWHFSNLLPFQTISVSLDLRMPGVQQEEISFSGFIDRIVLGQGERVDSIHLTQQIRCAYDPNDKIARSARSAGEGQVYPDAAIDYTIRFQNTGNDTAFQIIIRDTLDANLDINTLEILAASHPYEAYLKPDRTLEFRFYNINLPDSTTNEILSHGFVSYRINAKSDVAVPSIIQNTAHIYFDYNGSIQTNTAVTELVEFGTSTHDEKVFRSLVRAYPNPAGEELWVHCISNDLNAVEYKLATLTGRTLLSGILHAGETNQLSIASLPAGVYILHSTSGTLKGSVMVVKGR